MCIRDSHCLGSGLNVDYTVVQGLVGTMVEKITGDAIGLAPSFTEKTKLKARASAMTKDVTDLDVRSPAACQRSLPRQHKMGLSRPQIVLLVAWSALILAAVLVFLFVGMTLFSEGGCNPHTPSTVNGSDIAQVMLRKFVVEYEGLGFGIERFTLRGEELQTFNRSSTHSSPAVLRSSSTSRARCVQPHSLGEVKWGGVVVRCGSFVMWGGGGARHAHADYVGTACAVHGR
eukprot:2008617-Rhodomonas_salina.1